jgi:hypothetical protein
MREFETELRNAFRAPMDRPPGRDVVAELEDRLRFYDRLRVAAVAGGGFAGVSVLAGALSAAHAGEALPDLLRMAGAAGTALAMHPTLMVAIGGVFFLTAMARVVARDL